MKLKYFLLSICLLILLSYGAFWFFSMRFVASYINDSYSNRSISTRIINTKDEHFIKFAKAEYYGFPFKFGLKIIDFTEDTKVGLLECKSPIHIEYDLIRGIFKISYAGAAIGRYKPLQSGFGSKIISNNYSIYCNIPITLKLINILRNKKDIFEIVNFIHSLHFDARKISVHDLIDNQLLYDQEFEKVDIIVDSSRYYKNVEDVLLHLPKGFDIEYNVKHNKINYDPYKHVTPPSLLFWLFKPLVTSAKLKLKINTNESSIATLFDHLEINAANVDVASSLGRIHSQTIYQSDTKNHIKTHHINTDSKVFLVHNFANQFMQSLEYIKNQMHNTDYTFDNALKNKYFSKILKELENQSLTVKGAIDLTKSLSELYVNLNKFRISGNQVAVNWDGHIQHIFSNNFHNSNNQSKSIFKSKGVVLINHYHELLTIVLENIYGFGATEVQLIKQALSNISDHAGSKSEDISFEYDIDSSNLANSKIGALDLMYVYNLFTLKQQFNPKEILRSEADKLLNKISPKIDKVLPTDSEVLNSKQLKDKLKGNLLEKLFN